MVLAEQRGSDAGQGITLAHPQPLIKRVVQLDLAAASNDEENRTVEFLLENLSKRMAASIREEAEGLGAIKPKVGEKAMNAVVSAIRDLVAIGEIELLDPDEEK